jgi:hypothetical protein
MPAMLKSVNSTTAGPTAADMLTIQFLAWVAEAPRTYGEAMEAWRSTCPRLSIWEDAVIGGLVRLENGPGTKRGEARVTLTARGRALLEAG